MYQELRGSRSSLCGERGSQANSDYPTHNKPSAEGCREGVEMRRTELTLGRKATFELVVNRSVSGILP